jgi:hypothetical protein
MPQSESLASQTAVTDESSICGMPCIVIDVFADHTAAAGVGPAAKAASAQVRLRVKLSAGSVRSSRASASRSNCLPALLKRRMLARALWSARAGHSVYTVQSRCSESWSLIKRAGQQTATHCSGRFRLSHVDWRHARNRLSEHGPVGPLCQVCLANPAPNSMCGQGCPADISDPRPGPGPVKYKSQSSRCRMHATWLVVFEAPPHSVALR